MTRFFCNGKNGYCDRGNDKNIDCTSCEFANGTGGEYVDCPETNYERIKNMSVEEMVEFIRDVAIGIIEGATVETNVEPVRHGHWIARGDCGVTICSCCGWSIEECIGDKYCRECGARMDGKDEQVDE